MRKIALLVVFAVSIFGCSSAGSSDTASSTDAIVEKRQSLSRALTPPVAPPALGDIGRGIDEIFARESRGREQYRQFDQGGCRIRLFRLPERKLDEGGRYFLKGDVQRQDCEGRQSVHVILEDGAIVSAIVYSDDSGDGIVDEFSEPYRRILDGNADGKIDSISEWGPKLEGVAIEGFEAGWTPPAKPNRTREDTDFDGLLDRETVAAGAGSWWSRAR